MFIFFENLILVDTFSKKKEKNKILIFKFKNLKIRESSFTAVLILWHVIFIWHYWHLYAYKPIDRSLKTVSVTMSKSTEHNVTLTPFVVNLSYPRLSNCYRTCEIDTREGAESFALICLGDIVARKRRGTLGAEYFSRALYITWNCQPKLTFT